MQRTEGELHLLDAKKFLIKNLVLIIYTLMIFLAVFAVAFYLNNSFTSNSFNVSSDTQIVVFSSKFDHTILVTINVKSLNGDAVLKYFDWDVWSEITLSPGVHRFVFNTNSIRIIFSHGTQFQGDFSAKIIGNGGYEGMVTALIFVIMAVPAILLLLLSFSRKKLSTYALLTFLSLHLMLLLEFYNISIPIYPLVASLLIIVGGILYGLVYLVIILLAIKFLFFRTSSGFGFKFEISLFHIMGLLSILFSALLVANSGFFLYENNVIFLKVLVALYFLTLGIIAVKKSEYYRLQGEPAGVPAPKIKFTRI